MPNVSAACQPDTRACRQPSLVHDEQVEDTNKQSEHTLQSRTCQYRTSLDTQQTVDPVKLDASWRHNVIKASLPY